MSEQSPPTLQVVIIGAGQAGVTLSYFLQQKNIKHQIFEKHRPFYSWQQRWDAFYMNTANWMNQLPGLEQSFVPGAKDGELASKQQALAYFEQYLQWVKPPVQSAAEVSAIEPMADGNWQVTVGQRKIICRCIVVSTGTHNSPNIPEFARQLPQSVIQIHSSQYQNPTQIKTRNVLVVGSGSSGVQIAADIAGAGSASGAEHRVTLSMGGNRRFPWKVFGVSVHAIARITRLFDIRRDTWLGQWIVRRMPPSDPAAPPSPALLRKMGVVLKPKVTSADTKRVVFSDNSEIALADLTVVWCTGYQPHWQFLPQQLQHKLLDQTGNPRHERGVVNQFPGLYFLGLRFQYTLGSHILLGIGKDAAYIADCIENYLAGGKR